LVDSSRVVLHGAFEGANFGDTLLLRLFADRVRLHGVRQVFATNVSKHAADFCNVTPVTRRAAVRSGMPLVFCGGGYFGEPPLDLFKWRLQLWRKHLSVAVPAALLNRRSAILGVGVGPLASWWVRWPVALVFRRATVCAVRDQESIDYTRAHLSPNCLQVADTVLGCSRSELLAIAGAGSTDDADHPGAWKRRIAVHLSGGSEDRAARRALAGAIETLAQNHDDVHLVLLSDKDPGSELDFFAWFDRLDPRRVTKVPFRDPGQALREMERSWGVITTKLHVGICAAVMGKRVVSTPRHPKTLRLYRQLDRMDVCTPLDDAVGEPMGVLSPMMLGQSSPVRIPAEVSQQARRIWDLLAHYLGTSDSGRK
jgi:polysaccharide pyruvyl transferase WcaK-like protein